MGFTSPDFTFQGLTVDTHLLPVSDTQTPESGPQNHKDEYKISKFLKGSWNLFLYQVPVFQYFLAAAKRWVKTFLV